MQKDFLFLKNVFVRANGKWLCDYTNQGSQGMAAVNVHTIEGTEAHAHPSHAIRAYNAPTNEDILVRSRTQYAPPEPHHYRNYSVLSSG